MNKDFDCTKSVVAFRNSVEADYPLVLVLGREYNGDGDGLVDQGVSIYDPVASSGAKFWNSAMRFVVRCGTKDAQENIDKWRESGHAPVIFSNVFPIEVPNADDAGKGARRSGCTDDQIESHLQGVFKLPISRRVKVVVISVDHNFQPPFGNAIGIARKVCRDHNIPSVVAPYFGARYSSRLIDEEFRKDDSNRLEDINLITSTLDEYRYWVDSRSAPKGA